ncbi:MAG: hypothetical protein LBE06_08655 [Azoarcus sp.]|nr:hypothetical protein [Azoarcus sp.]
MRQQQETPRQEIPRQQDAPREGLTPAQWDRIRETMLRVRLEQEKERFLAQMRGESMNPRAG